MNHCWLNVLHWQKSLKRKEKFQLFFRKIAGPFFFFLLASFFLSLHLLKKGRELKKNLISVCLTFSTWFLLLDCYTMQRDGKKRNWTRTEEEPSSFSPSNRIRNTQRMTMRLLFHFVRYILQYRHAILSNSNDDDDDDSLRHLYACIFFYTVNVSRY